jgi:hypothetical protein
MQHSRRIFCRNSAAFCVSTISAYSFGSPGFGAQPSQRAFKLLNGVQLKSQPDLSTFGLEPVNIIYEQFLSKRGGPLNERWPNPELMRVIGERAAKKGLITVLDVESWYRYPLPQRIERYVYLLNAFRAGYGSGPLGYYGVAPGWAYKAVIAGRNSEEYKNWKKRNHLFNPIIELVDFLSPELYTYTSNAKLWQAFAQETVLECKRLAKDKPVYPFLMPRYHPFAGPLNNTPIPAKYWRLQLDTLKEVSDGLVIWTGPSLNWDSNAPWWQQTVEFIRDSF